MDWHDEFLSGVRIIRNFSEFLDKNPRLIANRLDELLFLFTHSLLLIMLENSLFENDWFDHFFLLLLELNYQRIARFKGLREVFILIFNFQVFHRLILLTHCHLFFAFLDFFLHFKKFQLQFILLSFQL